MECMEREKGKFSDNLFENVTFFKKDFNFIVNFVNSSKSKTQHDIHIIYSHVIASLYHQSIEKIYKNLIPTSQYQLNKKHNKIKPKTKQNRHLLTFQHRDLQNLLPEWFTLRNMNITVGTSLLHFTILRDEDNDDDPPFPFILSPINTNQALQERK